ncbi:hypothetical protein MIND_00559900 [Mycena indigotica]|uniref:Uncharacterized protein n=1 Tax=Mycena indigotica TaxID=2126181 RepID=A0A8H6SZR3_9AGAR|nr:uncharacterized protein MIND_00559900 [Mycena indigotica]KAF7307646.1 hypothetical protein MIND_00559900 [Mycena indigotica]
MQFLHLFAPLILIVSANATTLKWFAGENCTGALIETSSDVPSDECITQFKGGARSIAWTGVKNNMKIEFFSTGGSNLLCGNKPLVSLDSSGCTTAPTGFDWRSVKVVKRA